MEKSLLCGTLILGGGYYVLSRMVSVICQLKLNAAINALDQAINQAELDRNTGPLDAAVKSARMVGVSKDTNCVVLNQILDSEIQDARELTRILAKEAERN